MRLFLPTRSAGPGDRRAPALAARALCVVAVVLLAACAAPVREIPPVEGADARARALAAAGAYSEAADEYLSLAASAPPAQAAVFRIRAAAALLDSGDPGAARATISPVEALPLPPRATAQRDLVLAEIARAEGRPEAVLERLSPDRADAFEGAARTRFHALRVEAYELTGNHVEAATERVRLDPLLADPLERSRNHRAVWEALSRLTPSALARARISASAALAGWLELADISSATIADPESLSRAVASWRERYPGHPADTEIVPELVYRATERATPPARVGLMLPLTGRFGRAGRAVRDGFMAAWYADTDTASRPAIDVHDTAKEDAWAVYSRAVQRGAEFVVGPLQRDAVEILARSDALMVPVLALNATSDGAPAAADMYQFSLSPEAEARQVAERIWFDGAARGVVLAPEGDWGQRVADAFAGAFESLGGTVLEVQRYPSDAPDMSGPTKAVLDVDASEERRRELTRLIGRRVEFETRRRQDASFVFMAAFPRQARQIRPQLQFHKAADLPVYATSHAFSGRPDPEADRDVAGVLLGDMPWLVGPLAQRPEPARRVLAAFPEADGGFLRLFAFGWDAYRLIPHLGRLRAQRFAELPGATGQLSLDRTRTVQRRLVWARFRDGLLRPADGQ